MDPHFNPYDFSAGVNTNNGTSEPFVTIHSDFDEGNFVQKTGSIMTGSLILEGTAQIIFTDGSNQTRAFDESNVNAIASVGKNAVYKRVSKYNNNSVRCNNNIR